MQIGEEGNRWCIVRSAMNWWCGRARSPIRCFISSEVWCPLSVPLFFETHSQYSPCTHDVPFPFCFSDCVRPFISLPENPVTPFNMNALREFQTKAYQRARKGNCILVGPTGVGKTMVSMMLLKDQDYSSGRSVHVNWIMVFCLVKWCNWACSWWFGDNYWRRVAFFLAPTRLLAEQQHAKISETVWATAKLCVGRELDLWTMEEVSLLV